MGRYRVIPRACGANREELTPEVGANLRGALPVKDVDQAAVVAASDSDVVERVARCDIPARRDLRVHPWYGAALVWICHRRPISREVCGDRFAFQGMRLAEEADAALTAFILHATHLADDRVGIEVREHCRVAHVGGGARRCHHSEFLVGDTRVVAMLLSRDVALQLNADAAESRKVKFEEEVLDSVVVVRCHDKGDTELGIRMAGFAFETVDRIDPAGRAVVYARTTLRIVYLPRAIERDPDPGWIGGHESTGMPNKGRAVRREGNVTPRISEHLEKFPDAAIQQRLTAEELDARLPG